MNGFYNRYRYRRLNNDGALVSGTIRCLLLRSTGAYVFDPDHDFVSDVLATGVEISVASYARQTLGGKTLTLDDTNNRAVFDCDNIAFGNLESGQTVAAVLFYEFITNDAASPLILHIDGKIKVVAAAPAVASPTGAITGATQANPVVITSTAHGRAAGDKVYISGVGGMTQINNLAFTVANPTANTFELQGIDGTGYTAYTSGGTWVLATPVYVEPLKEAVNDGTVVTIGSRTGTVTGSHAKGDRVFYLRSLSGTLNPGDSGNAIQSSLNLPVPLGGGAFNVNIHASGLFADLGSTP